MDMIIRRARMADGRQTDIGIQDGHIAALGVLTDRGREEIDAQNHLVSLPLVDAHIHLDATLTVPQRTTNMSGTLLEGIQRWSDIKPDITVDDVKTRARQAILWEVAHGVLAIRSHVDICDARLTALTALKDLREELADLVDLQLVAFPQEGVMCYPQGPELLRAALHQGADIVGGIPHYEWTREDGLRELELVFQLARDEQRLIDVHCDETDDEQSRFVETMARLTAIHGLGGRVAASHVTAMHSYPPAYAFKLRRILRQADLAVIANPLTNVVLQGRFDQSPTRRGMAPIKALDQDGIPVALGFDCIMDPWYPLGTGNMLQAAWMALHLAHMTGRQEMGQVFKMVTENGHRIFRPHAPRYLREGEPADLVVWDAPDPIEALRTLPVARYVLFRGRLVASNEPARHTLYWNDKEYPIDFYPQS